MHKPLKRILGKDLKVGDVICFSESNYDTVIEIESDFYARKNNPKWYAENFPNGCAFLKFARQQVGMSMSLTDYFDIVDVSVYEELNDSYDKNRTNFIGGK